MDLTKLGNDIWTEPGLQFDREDPRRGFQNDASNVKLASSVSDLLQLTRSRAGRQLFVEQSQTMPSAASRPDKKKLGKVIESRGLSRSTKKQMSISNVQEQPVTRGDIRALEIELHDRIKTVMFRQDAEMYALDSGNLYQPHNDTFVLIKHRMLNDIHSDEERYAREPWLECMVKCECLNEVCDHVASKLVDILAVSSLEIGNVLRSLRVTFKQSFDEMKSSWRSLHKKYSAMELELEDNSKQLLELKQKLSENDKNVRQQVEGEIEELKKHYEKQRSSDRELQHQTEFHVEQMSETLKNLNGIFKTMQSDVDAARAADTVARCNRLEKQVMELKEQCSAMEQVKKRLHEETQRTSQLTSELSDRNTEIENLKEQLKRRDESIGELMEREALRNAEIDKLQRMAALRNEADEALELVEPPSSVLCIKCKKGLDDLTNLRAAILGAGRSEDRVVCQSFRVLLPNLKGKRPHRSVEWIRHCMRSILAAKTREGLALHPIHTDIPRFPEFVYAWFEPDLDGIKSAKDIHSAYVQADEDRWGFYYGIKTLAQDDPEGKIFWALLDEAQGEDGLAFVCYCFSVVMSLGGVELWSQIGDSFNRCAGISIKQIPLNSIQQEIWLDIRVAKDAVRKILVRALKSQLQEVLEAVDALKEVPKFPESFLKAMNIAMQNDAALASGNSNNNATNNDNNVSGGELNNNDDDSASVVSHMSAEKIIGHGDNPSHINMFVWIRLLLHRFQIEQSHRAAAVRLMFDTASVGALTSLSPNTNGPGVTPGGAGNTSSNTEDGNHVEFPQFQAVMKTLYKGISATEIAGLYAICYSEGRRKVTAAVFLKVAESKALFSRAMRLAPLPLLRALSSSPQSDRATSEEEEENTLVMDHSLVANSTPSDQLVEHGLDSSLAAPLVTTTVATPVVSDVEARKLRTKLGALIHRKMADILPELSTLMKAVPERWRAVLIEAVDQVEEALTESYAQSKKQRKTGGAGGGGYGAPVSSNNINSSAGLDGSLSQSLWAMDGLQPYVMYRRLLSLALAAKCFSDNPLLPNELFASQTYPGTTMPRMTKIRLQSVEAVLGGIEQALFSGIKTRDESKKKVFDHVRRSVAARRIQIVVNKFLSSDVSVPRQLRKYMRPGYLRGRGQIKLRRVYQEPWWALTVIGDIYTFKLAYDRRAASLGLQSLPIDLATSSYFFHFWGNIEVSERSIHDLCLAVRTYQHALPRLRLFAAFIGDNWSDLDPPIIQILQTEHAISRYLDLVVALHGAGPNELEGEAEEHEPPEEGLSRGLITELFPCCGGDPSARQDKKDIWFVTSGRVSGAAVRWMSKQAALSMQLVEEALSKLREDPEGRIDADDACWVLMMAWAKSMTNLMKSCTDSASLTEKRHRKADRVSFGFPSGRYSNSNVFGLVSTPPSSRRMPPALHAAGSVIGQSVVPNVKIPVLTWTSLTAAAQSALQRVAAPNTPGGGGIGQDGTASEIDATHLAAVYTRMLCEGKSLTPIFAGLVAAPEVGVTSQPPVLPSTAFELLLKESSFWDVNEVIGDPPSEVPTTTIPAAGNAINHAGDEEDEQDEEAIGDGSLPRRLILRVLRGSGLIPQQLALRKVWVAYREVVDKLLEEMLVKLKEEKLASEAAKGQEAAASLSPTSPLPPPLSFSNSNSIINNIEKLASDAKQLLTRLEVSLAELDVSRSNISTSAVYESASAARRAAIKAATIHSKLQDLFVCFKSLNSCVAEIVYATKSEYPKDPWKAGRKLHLERSSAYR